MAGVPRRSEFRQAESMKLPLTPEQAVWLAIPAGIAFGALLQRGGVTRFDTIVNQFRFRDFTVLKVMLTAIVVGGLGVWALNGAGAAQYQVKPANLLAVLLGAGLFGIGMAVYGYCPGTGIAAVATGRIDALAGVAGMVVGGMAYGLCYGWIRDHVESVWALGKVRLPQWTGIPDGVWWVALPVGALALFILLERRGGAGRTSARG